MRPIVLEETITEHSTNNKEDYSSMEQNIAINESSNKLKIKDVKNVNKNRRKSTVPQKSTSLSDCSLDEESQVSQSSLDESSNSAEENEVKKLPEKTFKSKCDIKCNMCEKQFQYKSEFDSHYKHSYNQTPVYTCLFCNKTMEKYSSFRSHCYRHITKGRFKCDDCDQGFDLESHLHGHIIGKHRKEKPFSCKQCSKQFSAKAGLKIHLKKHSLDAKEDYPCAECGKVLHTRGGLTAHMNVHRLGRRFMCDICGKTFTQKVNMQQHAKQHTGDKPYKCDICGKAFAEKSHLTRHQSHHSDDRPFKCDVCGKMYKTERCLKVHSLVHGADRPYVCSYCSKGFLSKTKLNQHYNIHTGERPFECKFCDRKFTNYPNLLKHTRRKHNLAQKPSPTEAPTNENTTETLDDSNVNLKPRQLEIKSESSTLINDITDIELFNYQEYDVYGLSLQPSLDLLPHLETVEPIHYDHLTTDFKLSKSEELFLQKGIHNFPVTDIEPKDEPLSASSHFDLVPLPYI